MAPTVMITSHPEATDCAKLGTYSAWVAEIKYEMSTLSSVCARWNPSHVLWLIVRSSMLPVSVMAHARTAARSGAVAV